MDPIELDGYRITDDFFGSPYLDADEWRDEPVPHRFVHGGFSGTDTRFALCFPPKDLYEGRMFQPLQGGNAGDENVNYNPHGAMITGGLEMIFRLGGYSVESNMGHVGDVLDPKAGDDPTIYGWRAAAETARLSKHLAAEVLGRAPSHSYVYGGSGGARRSPLCLAYAPDVWDGAMPFMGDGMCGDHGEVGTPKQGAGNFATMFNVQRLLGDRIYDVVDAASPGGTGDPFEGLSVHEREELALLYRVGFPRGAELMIAQPMGQIWLWSSMAEWMTREDPYFEAFWNEPGHIGHDHPQLVASDLIDQKASVARVLNGDDVMVDPALDGPEHEAFRALVAGVMLGTGLGFELPCVIEVAGLDGYKLGATVRLIDGVGAGRELYVIGVAGNHLFCNSSGETSNARFTGVTAGDQVHVDNRPFLAYCYYARHHLRESREYDSLRIGSVPLFEQYEQPSMSPFMGTPHTGRFPGKMLWVQHAYDSSCWPIQAVGMHDNVIREVGEAEGAAHYRLRWLENVEHVPPMFVGAAPTGRIGTAWLVDYLPHVEQCLADLVAWVEEGVEPVDTAFSVIDGQIVLPDSAAERGGIQPVVSVLVNGHTRADVKVGEVVAISAHAEVPPGAGTLINARWDFDGSGTFPESADIDTSATAADLATTHSFDAPGTYFVTALVESHRDGDVAATSCRIPNLASARVVVT